jgi:putative transcriptional regulator
VIKVRIAELLEKRGRTQYWLAKETGLTPLTISKLVKGKTSGIEFATLNQICEVLSCQTSDVLAYTAAEKNKKEK